MARTRPDASPVVTRLAGALGGALLLVASLVPWTSRGAGSTVALVRIADLILAGTVDTWVPRPAGLVVYAIPLGGAILILGTGLERTVGLLVGATGVVLALSGSALALLALDRVGRSGFGPGAVAAGLGIALGGVAVVTGIRARRPRP